MQSQTETLPRMRLSQIAESVEPEREELARNAVEILGYKKMALALAVPDSLAYTLRKLEIQPLVLSSVLAYKQSKEKTGFWSRRKSGVAWAAIISFGAATVVVAFDNFLKLTTYPHPIPNFFAFFGLLASFIAPAIFGVVIPTVKAINGLFGTINRGHRTIRTWERMDLKGFDGNIPEFALNKAVQIKRELPKVKLSVDALTVQREEDRKKDSVLVQLMRDPFLVAELGTETFYIDVWDEKEYERSL